MDDARFWALIDLLGGVADGQSVRALEAELRPDEAGAFHEALGARVEGLLERRPVPESHEGDTAEWIAAAVVAAGREVFERELAAPGRLRPDDWGWSESEVLLVAGPPRHETGREDDADLGNALGLWLQWNAAPAPEGVTTSWTPENELGDQFDDPAYGRVPTSDPAWDAALETLAADPEFHRRRDLMRGLGLHLVVRDVAEWALTPWPSEELVDDVVLTIPAAQAQALAEEPRAELYLEAVVALVTSTQENLGLPD